MVQFLTNCGHHVDTVSAQLAITTFLYGFSLVKAYRKHISINERVSGVSLDRHENGVVTGRHYQTNVAVRVSGAIVCRQIPFHTCNETFMHSEPLEGVLNP